MTRVSFEEVEALQSRLREINAIPFAEIEWTRDGKSVPVSAEVAERWRFIGMTNATFVELREEVQAET